MNSEQKLTTESQRTQRLHRELSEQVLFVQSQTNLRIRYSSSILDGLAFDLIVEFASFTSLTGSGGEYPT